MNLTIGEIQILLGIAVRAIREKYDPAQIDPAHNWRAAALAESATFVEAGYDRLTEISDLLDGDAS